ncbi:MAG: RNA methyltransferase [Clostridia bacterium]|nr:RNA methyltransferase [Clostridia bacterium]
MVIVSKNNPLVKELSSLKEKKFREKSGSFLVEGEKMVRECVHSGLNIRRIIVRENYAGDTYFLPTVTFGEDAFRAICDEKTPQSIAAEVEIPVYKLQLPEKSCIVLDGVADPANVGAIIRTAVAAGYTELYCINCADPYSPKSVRASMSGVFFARIMRGGREEILSVLNETPLIAADMDGENVFAFTPPERFALCIGNEGNGLSNEIFSRAAHTVKIPMGTHTESLNAAVSAGILMYQLKKTEMLKRS